MNKDNITILNSCSKCMEETPYDVCYKLEYNEDEFCKYCKYNKQVKNNIDCKYNNK